MKTIVSTSLISFLLLSIVLGVFGLCFSLPMMRGLQTPPDILDEAVLYLRVYFAGFPFLFMYNILSNMFTSIGCHLDTHEDEKVTKPPHIITRHLIGKRRSVFS